MKKEKNVIAVAVLLLVATFATSLWSAGTLEDSDERPERNFTPPGQSACIWPTHNYNNMRVGSTPCWGSITDPVIRWVYDLDMAPAHAAPRPQVAVADLDGDGVMEVIVPTLNKKIVVLDGLTGSKVWEYQVDDVVDVAPAIDNLDRTGGFEIVVADKSGKVYALHYETRSLMWEFHIGDRIVTSPAIADIDDDGELEVVVGSYDNRVYSIEGVYGSAWVDHYYDTGSDVVSGVAVANVDLDSPLEVIVVTDDGNHDGTLHVLDGDGLTLQHYHTFDDASPSTSTTPVVSDIDDDDILDILVEVGTVTPSVARLHAFEITSGGLVEKWPAVEDLGDTHYLTPSVVDEDLNGDTDVIGVTRGHGHLISFDGSDPSNVNYYEEPYGGITQTVPITTDIDHDTVSEVLSGSFGAGATLSSLHLGQVDWIAPTGVGGASVAIADVDMDGEAEIIATDPSGEIHCIDANRVITGTKYLDKNGNGLRDPDEEGVNAATITLYRYDGSGGKSIYDETYTATDGTYSFELVPTGHFEVYEYKRCWGATTPNPVDLILIPTDIEVTVDFGNRWICDEPGPPSYAVSLDIYSQQIHMNEGETAEVQFVVQNTGFGSVLSFLAFAAIIEDETVVEFWEPPTYEATWELIRTTGPIPVGIIEGTAMYNEPFHGGIFDDDLYTMVKWQLPEIMELYWDDILTLRITIHALDTDELKYTRIMLFALSTEDHHSMPPFEGVPLASVNDRTNIWLDPTRGMWFPAHNSLDPYDSSFRTAHTWGQWSWDPTLRGTSGFAYSKAISDVYVYPL